MNYAVQMKGITMDFPGVRANDEVDFSVKSGEIHALVGENGAGKSTLMNILYGLYIPTAGEIYINNEKVTLHSALDAIDQGIGMVHQHFMLIPRLSVAENIVLGAAPRKGILFDRSKAYQEVEKLSTDYGFRLPSKTPVRNISLGMQQRVEIAKALYRKADILILDEPTAVLTPQEIDELGVMLKHLKDLGKTIIIITHKMQEILAFSDRVTVLRNGKKVITMETKDTNAQEITAHMVGREVRLGSEKISATKGAVMLEFVDVCYGEKLKNISFQLHAGEILGIAGIDNNGQKEITELAAGLLKPTSGQVLLEGRDISKMSVEELKAAGVGFIPQDRHRHGLVLGLDISKNLVLGYQKRSEFVKNKCFVNKKAVNNWAESRIEKYDIRPGNQHALAATLSGGNQQKVVVARESSYATKLIIADQPSRGVDVGAIELIYNIFFDACKQDVSVLLSSLELDELISVTDRIMVVAEGYQTGMVDSKTTSRYTIGEMMIISQKGVDA